MFDVVVSIVTIIEALQAVGNDHRCECQLNPIVCESLCAIEQLLNELIVGILL